MLEVTGGAMATMTPANMNVDWPATYLASELCKHNLQQAEELVQQVGSLLNHCFPPVVHDPDTEHNIHQQSRHSQTWS